jgi:prepilin-type N-terminal cleavage/methylation domain-containing protein
MVRSPCYSPAAKAAAQHSGGFTLIEVMVAVSIAAGMISLLVPSLLRQVAIGEQSNRLTAVEAAVSRDLNWFSNYARLWKLKSGSYPLLNGYSDVTQTNYTRGGAAIYEPSSADCQNLASNILVAASGITSAPNQPPNLISATKIEVVGQGFTPMEIDREITPLGNKFLIFYNLPPIPANNGLAFRREALLLVEAGAWCDVLP